MTQPDRPSSPKRTSPTGRPSFAERYLAARRKTTWRRIGWTLIEMLMAISIMGMISAIAFPSLQTSVYQARVARAITEISRLQVDVTAFETDGNGLPETLADVDRATLLDPWGNPYQYLNFPLDAASGGDGKGKGGGGGGGSHPPGARKDRFLVPINSFYDLYSMGQDGKTAPALTAAVSKDDIVRANDGGFIGLGAKY
ncbi:MAG: prepilin-type N-terminal cleavage/methylation domain-containing protein [Gemmatimonadetes bacterium]|nr:prepilin-type N-terminal cleavage/methylation domain-containing protein [Gemmatimonadota bacterium]